MSIERTDDNELRIGPETASIEDAGVLAGWLADRGVEVLFRVEAGRLRIDGLRDLADEEVEPVDQPRFWILVEDARVSGGFRRLEDQTYVAADLDRASGGLRTKGRQVRFELAEPTDG